MKAFEVAVGVVSDPDGRILISRRHQVAHQGGLWEFPGGKVEPGEALSEALQREFREEVGIEVKRALPLIRVRHRYPDLAVVLHVFRVENYSGQALGLEGQEVRWVDPCELAKYEFPEANLPILDAIRLPDYWPILNQDVADSTFLWSAFEELVTRGFRAMQIRCKKTAPGRLAEILGPLCKEARRHGIQLVVNGDPALAIQVQAAGVHLSAARLLESKSRFLSKSHWVGASCHTLEELGLAQSLGVDYAFLSPVFATDSHPESKPIGWDEFAFCVDQVNIPVYALGGMKLEYLPLARGHGARGIAGVSAFVSGD